MADTALRHQPEVNATAWLRLAPPATRLVLQCGPTARALAAAAFGVGFSEEPCRALTQGSRATLWMGPDEYLLLDADAAAAADTFGALTQSLGSTPASLVDISHRQVALELSGPYAEPILACGCPLDLDVAAFPVGYCTRTLFAKADILLWRTAPETFRLEVWRSFTGYLTGLLAEVARDVVA